MIIFTLLHLHLCKTSFLLFLFAIGKDVQKFLYVLLGEEADVDKKDEEHDDDWDVVLEFYVGLGHLVYIEPKKSSHLGD